MNAFLNFLSSNIFITGVITVLGLVSYIIRAIAVSKRNEALAFASDVVDDVSSLFKNSSDKTKLTRACVILKERVLSKTNPKLHWLVNIALSETFLVWIIEKALTSKQLEKARQVQREVLTEKLNNTNETKEQETVQEETTQEQVDEPVGE